MENKSEPWQRELREAYRRPSELLRDLNLTPAEVALSDAAAKSFAFRVTRSFAARMQRSDPRDALLMQVLPTSAECSEVASFSRDPLHERQGSSGPLLQKYAGRSLLITAGACAINCRYCFRRHFPYGDVIGTTALEQALARVAGDRSIEEIILSAGDPLILDNRALARIIEQLDAIPHLERLRIHSRLPVVLPSRVNHALLTLLHRSRLQTVLVIHANHPRELERSTRRALVSAADSGITLLNQAVLLKGINDDADTLIALSTSLFDQRVLPYYLNMLDPVAGAAHFAVAEARALKLHASLRDRLPGYLVPRLVREIPGAPAKMPLTA